MKRVKTNSYFREDVIGRIDALALISPIKKGALIELAVEAGLPTLERRIAKITGKPAKCKKPQGAA